MPTQTEMNEHMARLLGHAFIKEDDWHSEKNNPCYFMSGNDWFISEGHSFTRWNPYENESQAWQVVDHLNDRYEPVLFGYAKNGIHGWIVTGKPIIP